MLGKFIVGMKVPFLGVRIPNAALAGAVYRRSFAVAGLEVKFTPGQRLENVNPYCVSGQKCLTCNHLATDRRVRETRDTVEKPPVKIAEEIVGMKNARNRRITANALICLNKSRNRYNKNSQYWFWRFSLKRRWQRLLADALLVAFSNREKRRLRTISFSAITIRDTRLAIVLFVNTPSRPH